MEFTFSAIIDLTLEHKKGDTTSKHVATEFNLEVSDNLDQKIYLDKYELPNAEGCKVLSKTMVHGLIGLIHYANEHGFMDEVSHIKNVIDELNRGFVAIKDSKKSHFKNR